MKKTFAKRMALTYTLVAALVGSLLLAPAVSFASEQKEYIAYGKNTGTYGIGSIDIVVNGERKTAYCHNYGRPGPKTNGVRGYVHREYKEQDLKDKKLKFDPQLTRNVVYRGYPTNGANLQGSLTDLQFEAVTQLAVWHYTDNLSRDRVVRQLSGYVNATEALAAFDKLIAREGKVAPEHFKLDFYDSPTINNNPDKRYQDLLGSSISEVLPKDLTVNVLKVSSKDNSPLAGAKLVIKNATDNSVYKEWTSTKAPLPLLVKNNQSYVLSEAAAPAGYVLTKKSVSFRVTKEGKLEVKEGDAWKEQKNLTISLANTPKTPKATPTPTPSATPTPTPSVTPTPAPSHTPTAPAPKVEKTPTPTLAQTGATAFTLLGVAIVAAIAGLVIMRIHRSKN